MPSLIQDLGLVRPLPYQPIRVEPGWGPCRRCADLLQVFVTPELLYSACQKELRRPKRRKSQAIA
jgi:hypothetical protein